MYLPKLNCLFIKFSLEILIILEKYPDATSQATIGQSHGKVLPSVLTYWVETIMYIHMLASYAILECK